MSLHHNPRIVTSGLKVLIDAADPNCNSQRSTGTLSSGHRLYNLADSTFMEYLYNDVGTEAYQELQQDKGGLVLYHNAYDGTVRDTTWRSNNTPTRVNNYTVISWFKFDNVSQQSENIYGGGFDSRTSFYMSPGGTSEADGVLLYSDAGSTNAFVTNPGGGNDGQWHMRAYTVTGPDVGVQTCNYYRDATLISTVQSNSSHDNPDGAQVMRWGSWTNTYGNLRGHLNGFMYYERVLPQDELTQIYLATKTRYQ
jgi:hypothetical protein